MRGRTIYYRNRRILVFCGYKRNTPRPIYDLFSTAAETARTGENNETFITESNDFAESESGGAVGSDNESFISIASQQPETDSGISITHTAKGTIYNDVFALADNGIVVGNNSESIPTESKLSKAKSGTTTGASGETIKTLVPKFTESTEVVAAGESNKDFITSHHNQAESESGISTLQNAEAYNEQPTQNVIRAGKYATNAYVLPFEAVSINIPIHFYSSIVENYDNATGINVEYFASVWVIDPINATYSNALASNCDYFDTGNIDDYWHIFTDDGTFTVTADTEVTAEQYTIFNRYFQLVPDNNA